MHPLLESDAKRWLSGRGLPVPKGIATSDPDEAARIAAKFSGGAVVKALVPAGRRGKAGGVQAVASAQEARTAARDLLGREIGGFRVDAVYVEERVAVAAERFLSFTVSDEGPQIVASLEGGVEIEGVFGERPEAVLREPIDPLRGCPIWDATGRWRRLGLSGPELPRIAALTSALYEAFVAGDALTLELNPIAWTSDGTMSVVGAMMAVDEAALFRHPDWQLASPGTGDTNPREARIREANRALPGGEAQYVELDGDIGLFVGGGGAGLYLHDLIVDMGGRPANHCVTPPTGRDTRKMKEVLRAILDNPRVRCLLVGFNFAQMARADLRLQALAEVLDERPRDSRDLPIVVRLFGAGEDDARRLAATFPGMSYMERGTTLRDAAAEIVRLSKEARR